MTPVQVQLGVRAGISVAAVSGELDLDGRERFDEALEPLRDGQGPAVLDLAAVPFMDSSGLHVVISLWRSLERDGRPLAVAAPRDAVRKLFELTALDRRLPIYDDADSAVDAFLSGGESVSANAS